MWGMQVKLRDGTWSWVHPVNAERYEYPTKTMAEEMLNICYPEQVRAQKLGGLPSVRVQGIPDEQTISH